MKTSAILAPIHEPKFDFGLKFVESYNKFYDDEDLFLVFSNEEESNKFKSLASNNRYGSIVCNENLNMNNPITQKKYYGLKYLFNAEKYDKIATVDVDTIFIASADYDEKFKSVLKERTLYGSPSDKNRSINESCAKLFNNVDYNVIKQKTDNFLFYFWFNEIPVYEKNNFLMFMDYIKYDENVIREKLIPAQFDFIVYACYLIICDKIKLSYLPEIKESGTWGSFIELQHRIDPRIFKKVFNLYNPMWIYRLINNEDMKNVFMLVHTDRKK
jgi:hypothetical protein